jgi:DNA-binding response OmpR family regulator
MILVVEDDAGIADIIRRTLEDEDMQVALARDGEEGVRLGIELQPALVMLDMMLPLLPGEAVAAQLRRQPGGGPPIVVLSAAADIARIASAVGAVGFLAKPFDLDEVVELVERTIGPRLSRGN